MGRWEPDASGRLLNAAIALFTERGYEATTTAQIAERAGVTKTTLFRLFKDKPEIVFQAQDALVGLVRTGVEEAPPDSGAVELMIAGIRNLSRAHTEENRHIGQALGPILENSEELRERAAFKRAAITAALYEAVASRIGDTRAAGMLADLGVRAYYAGYEEWVRSGDARPLIEYVLDEVAAHRDSLRALA